MLPAYVSLAVSLNFNSIVDDPNPAAPGRINQRASVDRDWLSRIRHVQILNCDRATVDHERLKQV